MSGGRALQSALIVLGNKLFAYRCCPWNLDLKPGGALPYMGYIGMCRFKGYGFQAVYSRIGYINQNVWL